MTLMAMVANVVAIGVPPDTDYPRISASESASNLDTDIIFSHPSIFVFVSYLKGWCGYGYGKSNILFVSDPISECRVLDNDILWKKLFFNEIRH